MMIQVGQNGINLLRLVRLLTRSWNYTGERKFRKINLSTDSNHPCCNVCSKSTQNWLQCYNNIFWECLTESYIRTGYEVSLKLSKPAVAGWCFEPQRSSSGTALTFPPARPDSPRSSRSALNANVNVNRR